MEAATQERRAGGSPTLQRRVAWAGAGCATLFLLAVGVGMFWWQYVSYVPHVPPPSRAMPVPNARDDFIAATYLLPAGSEAQIRSLYGNSAGSGARFPISTPELRQIVRAAQPALKRVRVGLDRDFECPPILSFSQPFPELAQYRQLARLLAAESELALREGRTRDALRSGLDAMKMGEMVQRGGPLIHGLVGVAIGAIGLRSVEHAIDHADADTCVCTLRELSELDVHAFTAADALTGERDSGMLGLSEILRKSYPPAFLQSISGGVTGGGAPPVADPSMMLLFVTTPKRKILENYRRNVEAEIARARQPYYAAGTPPTPPTDPLNALLAPAYGAARFAWARQQAVRRSLLTRLAVRAYTLREGHLPPSLSTLVPKYLPAAPSDPFAPAPLVYRVVKGKPVIYSRGPDGDDDGGRDLGARIEVNSDGDLGSTLPPALKTGKAR